MLVNTIFGAKKQNPFFWANFNGTDSENDLSFSWFATVFAYFWKTHQFYGTDSKNDLSFSWFATVFAYFWKTHQFTILTDCKI